MVIVRSSSARPNRVGQYGRKYFYQVSCLAEDGWTIKNCGTHFLLIVSYKAIFDLMENRNGYAPAYCGRRVINFTSEPFVLQNNKEYFFASFRSAMVRFDATIRALVGNCETLSKEQFAIISKLQNVGPLTKL